jgi:very-short-patch-repair endonuclease
MCKELNLIIEVDGITHSYEAIVEKDKVEEDTLTQLGFKMVRFEDAEVLHDINRVRDRILDVIDSIEKDHPQPPPAGDS